ncbi:MULTISPECIES: P-loop NTPase fold protein [Paraburkholderia]|uniref:KAP NTPase domain-containing protein n=1 Tax=Paraburkholderia dioscoreae TaxID=2604047 RepID=A0A5Q4ZAL8_9BURK|nr:MULTISPECIES: P-loop NTPase fold protein [Paraburkholderia]MDR8397481.1 KAP family NTPase [Paraburkholderia sp. USG1]VVD27115.1 conserved protein of unknown function [Paraburkholderia dioscoreae]
MTRAVIESVINEFLDSTTPEVLAISGRWGVGKTYTLQNLFNEYSREGSLTRYAYVSAFGAKSIGELRSMILIKSRRFPVQRDKMGQVVEGAEHVFSKGRGMAFWKAITAASEKIPYGGKQITVLLETVAASLVSKTIICIDDIERLGSGIEMDELMGLVSELKTESQCKVILLFNEEMLGERAQHYERASEKVIDKKLAFVTTPTEAVELGLPANTPLRDYAVPCIEKLGICNIRTVQRIANGLRTIHSVIPDCSSAVKKQTAIAVTVFAGALYETGIGFPTTEEVKIYNWYSTAMGVSKDTIEEEWREKLHGCGFLSCDEFDAEVLTVLRNGYAHGSELVKYARALDEVDDRARLDGIFEGVWKTFHYRIDGTAQELMRAFVNAVEVAATVITPLNLNSTVRLLRDLGFSAEADGVVDRYVALNSGRPGLFKIDDSAFGKDIDDEYLKRRFAEVLTEEEGPLDLAAAMELMIEENSWNNRIETALLKATEDDFIALLKDSQGAAMRTLIDRTYRAAEYRGAITAPIAVTMTAALDKIASESDLNGIRISRWRQ